MASDVLYGRDVYKSYFDMQRFENSIYNKTATREKIIKSRKRIRILDRILVILLVIMSITFVSCAAYIMVQNIRITKMNLKRDKLEKVLEKKIYDNNGMKETLKKEIEFEDLKIKAYMELNMITPTEKNIIHFNKSNSGFVRQYENIR